MEWQWDARGCSGLFFNCALQRCLHTCFHLLLHEETKSNAKAIRETTPLHCTQTKHLTLMKTLGAFLLPILYPPIAKNLSV